MKYTKDTVTKLLKKFKIDEKDLKFDLNQIKQGMNVEREHYNITKDPEIIFKIAFTHLLENKDYYKLLKKYVEK